MSSLVGIGVACTVVFVEAVDTGPTNRSQRSSQVITIGEENAVGLGNVVVPLEPLTVIEAVGVGIMEGDTTAFEELF